MTSFGAAGCSSDEERICLAGGAELGGLARARLGSGFGFVGDLALDELGRDFALSEGNGAVLVVLMASNRLSAGCLDLALCTVDCGSCRLCGLGIVRLCGRKLFFSGMPLLLPPLFPFPYVIPSPLLLSYCKISELVVSRLDPELRLPSGNCDCLMGDNDNYYSVDR